MERQKRQIKPPEQYIIPKICYPRIRKKYKKHQKARYEVIPAPMKFTCIAEFFSLYADIGLRIYQGSLHHDTWSLNRYCDVRGMEILKEQNFRKVFLNVGMKAEFQLPAWQNLIEGLLGSENNELRGWGIRIKDFSLKYEEAQRVLSSDEVVINGKNEKELTEMNEEVEKKVARIFKEYPCFSYNCTNEKKNPVKQVCFNEQYLNELGYSLETFTTIALQEGAPRILPNDTAYAAKILLDNYYTLGKEGIETPEIISDLFLKNGYLRRIRYKMLYLPSYRDRVYSVIRMVILLGKENIVMKETEENCEMNQNFLEKIIQTENLMNMFMNKFYDRTLILPYSSSHKVCKIRELNGKQNEEDDEIIHKN